MAERAMKTLTPAQYAFLAWLHRNHPNVMSAAEERRASLSGFMDSLTTVFSTVMEKAPELMNQYVAGKTQLEQLKANIQRAKQGQYPIEFPTTPAFAQQMPQMQAPMAQSVPTWVWAAGGAILVYLLVSPRR